MAYQRFREALDGFDPSRGIEDSRTPPDTWYVDPKFFSEELEHIFKRSWIPVGRKDQVLKPGDYFAGELAGNPYVVNCDADGNLRAHHNVCRHKGAIVAQQEDDSAHSCTRFQCPYHGWEYGLDGKLLKAPMLGPQKRFQKERYGLAPISVNTWGPFVFIDLDGEFGGRSNPRDLEADVRPISEHLDLSSMHKLKFHRRYSYDLNCNWKVFVDNSLDGGYHVKYAHEGLASGLEMDKFETHIFDRTSIQICDTKGNDERLGEKVMYAYVFPNFFINRYGNMMDTNVVIPLAVDKCRVIFDFYFAYENMETWEARKKMRSSIASSHMIQQEDIDICESAHKGMSSMTWKYGRYSSTLEKAVYEFHRLLWHELKGINS